MTVARAAALALVLLTACGPLGTGPPRVSASETALRMTVAELAAHDARSAVALIRFTQRARMGIAGNPRIALAALHNNAAAILHGLHLPTGLRITGHEYFARAEARITGRIDAGRIPYHADMRIHAILDIIEDQARRELGRLPLRR